MTIRKRSGSFQADITVKGVRHRYTFRTAEDARLWLEDAKHAVKMDRVVLPPKAHRQAFSENLSVILNKTVKEAWAGSKSYKTLEGNAALFIKWHGPSKSIQSVTYEVIQDYIQYCRYSLSNSDATINRKLSAVRALFKTAVKTGALKRDAIPEIKHFKESSGAVNYLEKGEEVLIIEALRERHETTLADLVMFLLDTGCRVSEAIKLRWNMVSDGRVTFIDRKNGDFGTVPQTKRVSELLKRRHNEPKGPFQGVTYAKAVRTVRKVLNELGGKYEEITQPFHVFRHSCASRLAIGGADMNRIRYWMGHKSISTTMRYIKLSASDLDSALAILD